MHSGDRGPRLREVAVQAVRSLQSISSVSVIPQTSDQLEQALRLYQDRPDKDWSLTDSPAF